ncbi:3-oxoacyl-[acyl-carrier-protein] reductase [Candidatus Proelusimicrobium volucris]|uniref:3-oxoacyl-[acyl-carrier-protein] reductase n=1 Tax=Candidatus Proelusimicrobium volucris TaxID=3416225 RepID=UPI003D0FD99C
MLLDGKTAVITGASRGIGLGIAEAFLAQGAKVAICGTSEGGVSKAKEHLQGKYPNGEILALAADVSKSGDCDNFIAEVIKHFGRIDILVNNAGITRDTLLMRMSESDWDAVLSVNLKGAFLMSKAAVKQMIKQRSGSIINMSSVVGQSGNAAQANYSASKAGLIGLTKSLAKELASRNIRVNAIAPGFVKTEMTEVLKEELRDAILQSIPLKRFAEVKDIADAAVFLASENAGYITGQVLAVNGGLYI